MSNVVDLAALRQRPTVFLELPDELRLEVARAMIGFDFDPLDYLGWEVGEVLDAIDLAASELRYRLASAPGIITGTGR
jgi:hypothetical protein